MIEVPTMVYDYLGHYFCLHKCYFSSKYSDPKLELRRLFRQVLQLSSYLHLEFYHSHSHNLAQAFSVLYVHGSSLDLWKQHSSLELW